MASSVARRVAQRVLASPAASAAARAAWSAGQPTPETHPGLLQPGELLPGLAAAEFAARRAALAALLPPGAVALLPAAPITYMAGGCCAPACCCCACFGIPDGAPCWSQHASRLARPPVHAPLPCSCNAWLRCLAAAGVIPFPFRQSADFLYLTGITQPYALAVVDCDSRYRWAVLGSAGVCSGGMCCSCGGCSGLRRAVLVGKAAGSMLRCYIQEMRVQRHLSEASDQHA